MVSVEKLPDPVLVARDENLVRFQKYTVESAMNDEMYEMLTTSCDTDIGVRNQYLDCTESDLSTLSKSYQRLREALHSNFLRNRSSKAC